MRKLAAAFLAGIAIAGAIYLTTPSLGSVQYWPSGSRCRYLAPHPCGGLVPVPVPQTHNRDAWQIPFSILVGILGIAGGLVVLGTRPKQPLGNTTQAA